jgi:putative addiction module component (TIGR02574 family)
MTDPSKVLAEALDLPVRERLRIAGALLRSVDPEKDAAAEAWVAELDRRSASIENGTAQLIDAAPHANTKGVRKGVGLGASAHAPDNDRDSTDRWSSMGDLAMPSAVELQREREATRDRAKVLRR